MEALKRAEADVVEAEQVYEQQIALGAGSGRSSRRLRALTGARAADGKPFRTRFGSPGRCPGSTLSGFDAYVRLETQLSVPNRTSAYQARLSPQRQRYLDCGSRGALIPSGRDRRPAAGGDYTPRTVPSTPSARRGASYWGARRAESRTRAPSCSPRRWPRWGVAHGLHRYALRRPVIRRTIAPAYSAKWTPGDGLPSLAECCCRSR